MLLTNILSLESLPATDQLLVAKPLPDQLLGLGAKLLQYGVWRGTGGLEKVLDSGNYACEGLSAQNVHFKRLCDIVEGLGGLRNNGGVLPTFGSVWFRLECQNRKLTFQSAES